MISPNFLLPGSGHSDVRSDDYISRTIDRVLENDDMSGDGYVDYSEFRKAAITGDIVSMGDLHPSDLI